MSVPDISPVSALVPSHHGEILKWTDAAHAAFGEYLYIYLIKTQDNRGKPLKEKLAPLLQEIGIHSPRMDMVYGTHDLQLTVWMTAVRRKSLLRLLVNEQKNLKVESLYEFKADRTWRGLTDGLALKAGPQELRNIVGSGNWEKQELFKVNAIYSQPKSRRLRLDMFGFTPRAVLLDSFRDDLRLSLISCGVDIQEIHYGEGFCDVMISALVPSYEQAFADVEKVQEVLTQLGISAWSVLPSPPYDFPADTLDSIEHSENDGFLYLLGRHLDNKARDGLKVTLNEESLREKLSAWLDSAAVEKYSAREQNRIYRVLGNLFSCDKRAINSDLSFLIGLATDVESMLAQYRNFHRAAESRELDKSVERATDLGSQLRLLANAIENDSNFAELLKTCEHLEWQASIESLSELHRIFIEGYLVRMAMEQDYGQGWWSMIAVIPTAAALQLRLEAAVQQLIANTKRG